jgi:hypothetical protein
MRTAGIGADRPTKPVIEHCYRKFLLHNHDPEEREYPDARDQIKEVLIHGNYMSQKDIEFCLSLDLAELCDQAGFPLIEELHQCFVASADPDPVVAQDVIDNDRGPREASRYRHRVSE